jgi:hypothetical protein
VVRLFVYVWLRLSPAGRFRPTWAGAAPLLVFGGAFGVFYAVLFGHSLSDLCEHTEYVQHVQLGLKPLSVNFLLYWLVDLLSGGTAHFVRLGLWMIGLSRTTCCCWSR